VYTFSYAVDIYSPRDKKISYVSAPSFSNYIEQVGAQNFMTISEPVSDVPPTKDIKIYYKTT